MRSEAWTRERVELLKALWRKGETAPAITARLGGLSRSAVLGKVFRLRLGVVKVKPASAAPSWPAIIAKNSPAWRRSGGRHETALRQARAAASKRGKTLMELNNESCRWPHGSPGTARFFFCGLPEAALDCGIPYCPRHMKRAFIAEPMIAQTARPVSRAA